MRVALTIAAFGVLAGCGNDADPGPGNVTVGEARALDEAAEIVEQGRPQLPGTSGGNEATDGSAEADSEEQTQ